MVLKQTIRKEVRRRKLIVSSEALAEESDIVCRRLINHKRVLDAATVIAFSPLDDEVNIFPAVRYLHECGKRILLPRVISDTRMELCEYTGDDSLQSGCYGISEPKGTPVVLPSCLSTDEASFDASLQKTHPSVVAIIPGVAFDEEGHRLGRGKGYYDRFLAGCGFYTIGVAYSYQIFESIPCDTHDVSVCEVIYR